MTQPIKPVDVLHSNVYQALINPTRSMEVRGWLKTHQDNALAWRGSHGETMMHWAFLSDWALALDLRTAGLSWDEKDALGRTPMDWLNDRLWGALVHESTSAQLSTGGQERLRRQSEEQIRALWMQGARPSYQDKHMHPGVVWLRSGAFSLMDLLDEHQDGQGWLHWAPRRGHALHALVLSPNQPARRAFIKSWLQKGLSIDERDEDGRTALWYAVDAWVAQKPWRPRLLAVIRELLEADADPYSDDTDGASPFGLVARETDLDSDERALMESVLVPRHIELPV